MKRLNILMLLFLLSRLAYGIANEQNSLVDQQKSLPRPYVAVQVLPNGKLAYIPPFNTKIKKRQLFFPNIQTTKKFTTTIYAMNQFVAAGESGLIATSKNGWDWTIQDSSTTANLDMLLYSAQTGYVATGQDKTKILSTDGKIWVVINYSLSSPATIDTNKGKEENMIADN